MEIYVWALLGDIRKVSQGLSKHFLSLFCLFLEWSHFPFPCFRTTLFGNTAVCLWSLFRLSFFCSDFLSLWHCGCNLAFPPAGMRGCTRETDKEREKQNESIKRNQTGFRERCRVWLFSHLFDFPPSHLFSFSFSH